MGACSNPRIRNARYDECEARDGATRQAECPSRRPGSARATIVALACHVPRAVSSNALRPGRPHRFGEHGRKQVGAFQHSGQQRPDRGQPDRPLPPQLTRCPMVEARGGGPGENLGCSCVQSDGVTNTNSGSVHPGNQLRLDLAQPVRWRGLPPARHAIEANSRGKRADDRFVRRIGRAGARWWQERGRHRRRTDQHRRHPAGW